MAGQEKWYFTRDQLINSPSRKCGLDADKELAYRQQAANLIQDMGQRLQVSQLCINTAIVYMHRFYAFHSFTQFHRNAMAAAALFLAAKMEEQPRKLEHVIKVAHICLHRGDSTQALDVRSDHYQEQAQDLVFNENVLLQTLGFDVAIDHPHTHVVKTCSLIRASKDLAQTSYFMASNSLHLTTMCLQYRPTVVACFCIHLASKWSNWEIPQSNEGKHWFNYVDRTVTAELLEHLTSEFLHIFDRCPSRLKKKIMSISNSQVALLQASTGSPQQSSSTVSSAPSPFDKEPRKIPPEELEKVDLDKRQQLLFCPSTSGGPSKVDYREYRERQANLRRAAPPLRHPPASAAPNPPPSANSQPPHNNSSGSSTVPAAPANVPAPPSANPAAAAGGAAMAGSGGAGGSRWAPSNGVRQPPRHPQPRHPTRHSQPPPPEQRPRPPQAAPPSASLPPPAAVAPPPAAPAAPPPTPPARPPSLFSPEQRKPPQRPQPLPPPLSPFHSPPTAVASAALETDPALVSSLLKEAIPHRSDKKKKKEKHKHRDRDKRDERKKHKKSKDKRRESDAPSNSSSLPPLMLPNANTSTPIKITIPREAIVNSNVAAAHNMSSNQSLQDSSAPTRLKIKIPKERLRTEPPVPPVLKIKIPKEMVEGARKRPLPPQQGDNPPPAKSRQVSNTQSQSGHTNTFNNQSQGQGQSQNNQNPPQNHQVQGQNLNHQVHNQNQSHHPGSQAGSHLKNPNKGPSSSHPNSNGQFSKQKSFAYDQGNNKDHRFGNNSGGGGGGGMHHFGGNINNPPFPGGTNAKKGGRHPPPQFNPMMGGAYRPPPPGYGMYPRSYLPPPMYFAPGAPPVFGRPPPPPLPPPLPPPPPPPP